MNRLASRVSEIDPPERRRIQRAEYPAAAISKCRKLNNFIRGATGPSHRGSLKQPQPKTEMQSADRKKNETMRDVRDTTANQTNWTTKTLLPAVFITREGDVEAGGMPTPLNSAGSDMPETTASNRLRRALFETGQLIVTAKDGLSRMCFAGVGDPECLLVEALPRNVPVPALDHDFPGCLCSLSQAETILGQIYSGMSSRHLAELLDAHASRRHREQEEAADDQQRAA